MNTGLPFTKTTENIISSAMNLAKQSSHSTLTLNHIIVSLKITLPLDFIDSVQTKLQRLPKSNADPCLANEVLQFFQECTTMAMNRQDKYISQTVLILTLCNKNAFGVYNQKIKAEYEKKNEKVTSRTSEETSLPDFAVEMVEQALKGKYDPVVGREDIVRSLVEILSKKTKSNVILVGNPGVGKTSVITALANDIANDRIPALMDYKIYNVDIAGIVAGTGVRGEFEERFKKIITEATKSKVILFIDEIHMLMSAGNAQGSCDAANMLKPQLASGDIKCIGATTYAEFRKYVEKDHAFSRRFVKVDVLEPSIEDSITMLRGLRERIEAFHGVKIRDDALVCAPHMAKRYMIGRRLPDSAIDLVDTACASTILETETEPAEVAKMRSKCWSLGLEKASLEYDIKNKEKIMLENKNENLKVENEKKIKELQERIKGLDIEIEELNKKLEPALAAHAEKRESIDACKVLKQKIEEKRLKYDEAVRSRDNYTAAEIKSYIIPTLESKLESLLAKIVTEITPDDIASVVSRWSGIPVSRLTLEENQRLLLMGDRIKQRVFGQDKAVDTIVDSLIINRAGLSEPGKPIGCFLFLGPTGVGKTELAKAICYELFDCEKGVTIDMSEYSNEISLSKLVGVSAGYVGYGEGGTLTEPVKNKPYNLVLLDEIDHANPKIFNTLYQLLDEGRIVDGTGTEVDFSNCVIIMTSNLGYKGERYTEDEINNTAAKFFGPALFNRIDSVVHFNSMGNETMDQVFDHNIQKINKRLAEKGLYVIVEDDVKREILERTYSYEFGVRPLKKYLQKYIVGGVARCFLANKNLIDKNGCIVVNFRNCGNNFEKYYFDFIEKYVNKKVCINK